MKIAITADTHLRRREETPERYNALENILKCISRLGIKHLILAGDTFDKGFSNYADFEDLCKKYPDITLLLIPGNHDLDIKQRFFAYQGIRIFEKPTLESIGDLNLALIPYRPGQSIDENIVELRMMVALPERWVLVGHGDYITKGKELNPAEPDGYMFISRTAIEEHKPTRVILGHIHKPSVFDNVVYPGSPCPLDVTETGTRRFIIYDTAIDQFEDVRVSTDRIYFVETIVVLPCDGEIKLVRETVDGMIKKWGILEEDLKNVRLRLRVDGYCTNKPALERALIEYLTERGIRIYEKDGLDLSNLRVVSELDEERKVIIQRAIEILGQLLLKGFLATRDEIIERIMEMAIEK